MSVFKKNIEEKTVKKIHEFAMKTMNEKGIKFVDEKAINVFKDNSFKVCDDIVYFAEDKVMNALKSVPSKFTIKAYDEKYNVVVGGDKSIFCPAYGPVFVSKNEQMSESNRNDLINFTKLTQTSEVIDMINPYVVTPFDVPVSKLQSYQQAVCLKYGSKPMMCITNGYENSDKSIEMIKKVYGSAYDECVTIGLISALSPLSYDKTMIEAIFAFAKHNQAMIFGCGALPGATSPVSIIGTMVVATSELLAGIVLSQLIKPGVPVVFGNVAAATDLRFVTPAIGTAGACKIAALSKAMCEFYNIPCRGGGSLSDAKQTDYQAGSESNMVMFSTLMSNMDYIIHSCGILDSFNIIGYEKFILDEQNIANLQFLLKDSNIEDDVIGYETIKNIGHGEQYLQENHTLEYMRDEIYCTNISLRGYYDSWQKAGAATLIEQVNDVINTRLSEYSIPNKDKQSESYLNNFLDI